MKMPGMFKPFCTVLILLSMFTVQSCKKDEQVAKPDTTIYSATISISHFFGDSLLHSAPATYITASSDTIRVSQLQYYFTNIVFQRSDGSLVAANNYHLVDFSDPLTSMIKISNIPKGEYTRILFFVGVDSLHNHSGAQTGALDPAYSMFWTWNVGYIFFRINGNFGSTNTSYSLDLGGDANLMKYSLPLNMELSADKTIKLKMDLKELFQTPFNYDLKSDQKDIHTTNEPGISKLVQNSVDMFSVLSVQ